MFKKFVFSTLLRDPALESRVWHSPISLNITLTHCLWSFCKSLFAFTAVGRRKGFGTMLQKFIAVFIGAFLTHFEFR